MAAFQAPQSNKIHVSNLSWDTTTEGLVSFFQLYGPVAQAEVMYHEDSGRSKGWGLVEFR